MTFRKPVYAIAGATTVFMGTGRPEFNPKLPLRPFEEYLQETAELTLSQLKDSTIDEGIIGSFMSARFIHQANLPGFLPTAFPSLQGKPCTAVEGACGTGGRALAMAVRAVLSDMADVVAVLGFEMQNSVKAVYGADILAGAAYYRGERKNGEAHFFPGIFSKRAGAYYEHYGYAKTREAFARWYEQMILNARTHPKAQEYHNKVEDLFEKGMTPPDPERFLPFLNVTDCSKISDGAASIVICSEEGLKRTGFPREKAVEIVSLGEAEDDITKPPKDLCALTTTRQAVEKLNVDVQTLSMLELHDCFTITGLLALEAVGLAKSGQSPQYVLDGFLAQDAPLGINLTGGLGGFGHPTGATGVRQMVDLQKLLPTRGEWGMMISMGGNDKTVTAVLVRSLQK